MSKSLPFPLSLSLPLALSLQLAATGVHAQTVHTDQSVLLDTLVVTASPLARSQAELLSATSVLDERELAQNQQPTLGETLANTTGLSSTYFGPAASRPIIRGLGANRVRILQNGTDTIDASNTSPDHAVSLDPLLVKRVEVVRGPAALLYGSAAVGGVVNVIDHRIETEMPAATVSGALNARYDTNADANTQGAILDLALLRRENHAVILHLDGFRRQADDTRVPGLADPTDPTVRNRIPNSAIDSDGGSVGLSYVGETLKAGINYNGFNTLYGVVEPDIEIDLKQRRVDFAAELTRDFGIFTSARLKLGHADYRHVELDAGAPETVFTNTGHDGRLEFLHRPLAGFEGAIGLQAGRSDFDAIGDEAFLPPSLTETVALFLFEETRVNNLTWQFGARVEHQAIDTRTTTRFPVVNTADQTTFSGSAGVIYSPNDTYAHTLSVSLTERAPNTQELFADGPHAGTGRYEIGNPNFDTEKSLGIEIGTRKKTGFVTGSANLFANVFDGFIFEEDVPGSFLDEDGNPDAAGLQEARFQQRDALFYGVEIETLWHLHAGDRHTLDLKLGADYTRAEDTNGDALPRIPPLKGVIGLAWTGGPWSAGLDWHLVAPQSANAPGETETDGHTLLSANLAYRLVTGRVTYDVFVRGTNLTDESARMHTSFLKDIAPLPGRNVALGLRASF